MIIRRKTRKDLIIDSEKELIDLLQKTCVYKLKRKTAHNSVLIETILQQTYSSSAAFRKEMKKLWKPAYHDFDLFGWTEEEINEEKQKKKEIKKRALETSLQRTGLTEKEYRRMRSNLCVEFWIAKGFSAAEAETKIKEVQSKNSKRQSDAQKKESSPRTLEYWIKKGVSNPEERRSFWQKENSQRCPEYWMKRGCSHEEAVKLVSTSQRENVRLYYVNTPEVEIRAKNTKCPEYYRAKGWSEEEIKQQLSDNGRTFSLEICQAKYGEEEGFAIWKERQKRWQLSFNDKTPEELRIIREKQGMNQTWRFEGLNVPGIFYIIQISNENVKIGITTRALEKRYQSRELAGKRIHVHSVDDIQIAYLIEQIIKTRHKTKINRNDYGVFGWTEVLADSFDNVVIELNELINTKDDLNLLLERTKQK